MKRSKGFTLIELIMVIVILGILAAVAIPKFVDLSTQANTSVCQSNQGAIESACAIYYASSAANQVHDVTFPDDYTYASMYAEGVAPTCTETGTYTYSQGTGGITCNFPNH